LQLLLSFHEILSALFDSLKIIRKPGFVQLMHLNLVKTLLQTFLGLPR